MLEVSLSSSSPLLPLEKRRLEAATSDIFSQLSSLGLQLLMTSGIPSDNPSTQMFDRISSKYADDDRSERRAVTQMLSASAALLSLAVAVLVLGLHESVNNPTKGAWSFFSIYLTVGSVCALGAGICLALGERRRRSAQEATRLSRQFQALESFLDPMPPMTRDIVRVSLAPRLFSRNTWDDDPLREPVWPTTQEVIHAGSAPRHRAMPSSSGRRPKPKLPPADPRLGKSDG